PRSTTTPADATPRPVQFVTEPLYVPRRHRRRLALIIVLSPAKRLDFTEVIDAPATARRFVEETASLAKTTRRLTRADLRKLMSISDKLADLNRERFQAFDPESQDGVQAAFAFAGDVYEGLK